MKRWPLIPVTMVGSWPRPPELLRAQSLHRRNEISDAQLEMEASRAVLDLLRIEEDVGLDILTDGEMRRDNFYSFVARKLSGVRLMTLLELLDHVDDKAGFEKLLKTLDVPASSLTNPTCVGKIDRRGPLAVDELRFLKSHTTKPVKIPLPGPYILTRAMWVKGLSSLAYPSKEALAEDVVRILREEIEELIAGGADFIQLDEPVLTEVLFAPKSTRTFMCASLAARGDPTEELEFATWLIQRVVEGFHGPILGLHVCRGNWSQNESILLSGGYTPLVPYLERLRVDQLVLEYATPRAGQLLRFEGKMLGLGVVNPRTNSVESPLEIEASIRRALELYPSDAVFINPDCGFGTFSRSPVNTVAVAEAKLRAMVEAARATRRRIGEGELDDSKWAAAPNG